MPAAFTIGQLRELLERVPAGFETLPVVLEVASVNLAEPVRGAMHGAAVTRGRLTLTSRNIGDLSE